MNSRVNGGIEIIEYRVEAEPEICVVGFVQGWVDTYNTLLLGMILNMTALTGFIVEAKSEGRWPGFGR